jgi:UDP-2,4-diacetamido-2,4,6-trideoxy-beta-L-altropyranose hydrolase
MGTGHVMRCLTLAEALRARGARVQFVCRDHPGNLIALLRERGFETAVLPRSGADRERGEHYAAWLGATQAEDAAQTIAGIESEALDCFVMDHYGISVDWERCLRPRVGRLIAVDDLADRPHECDLLLDQNYADDGATRYSALVPAGCKLLLGPRYALLNPVYASRRRSLRRHDGSVKRVFLFFGGADARNATGLALRALSGPGLSDLDVDVVLNPASPHRAEIERQAAARGRCTVHGALPHLEHLLSRADLAIGAGGATTWERMCLGVPAVLVSIAENQQPACRALSRAGLVSYAGHISEVDAENIACAVRELLDLPGVLAERSARSQLLVDGLGTARVVEAMLPSSEDSLRLRPASEDDMALFHGWANDPVVRANAFSGEPISWPTHEAWFRGRLQSDAARLFVLEANRLPVGQVRFDLEGGEAHIDYSLDELVRGRGWGARLLSAGIRAMQWRAPVRFRAQVKSANLASRAVFESLGFLQETRSAADRCDFYLDSPQAERTGAVSAG